MEMIPLGKSGYCLIDAPLLGLVGLAVITLASSSATDHDFAARQAEARKSFDEGVAPFVKTYCVKCHGVKRQKGGLNYEVALKNPGISASRQQWEQAVANVKAHDMPPDDEDKLPSDEERRQFLDWIEQIKYLSPKDPGPFEIRRLTKTEYGNTLRDLYGVDTSVIAELPDEVSGEGFLNTFSPLQSELYLSIANDVLGRIIAPDGARPTDVQRRLFGEIPPAGLDPREAAKKVAHSLARDAFRRPPSEEEIEVLLDVFDLARESKLDHHASLGLMLKAVLVSPQFLFITPAREVAEGSKIVPLDDHQLASRLSYFLWSTTPDAELSSLADSGKLHEPEILRAQVKRLLEHERSRAIFDGFGSQWLGIEELKGKTFDTKKYPLMTSAMRSAMIGEARLFFDSIIRGNESAVRFVDSDYTFLNETIAILYGLETSVRGPEMRQVTLADTNRGGILGMPAVLATTSFPNRTSPVKRGVWVLEQVLGEHVPPAPPNVPALEKQDQKKVAGLTLRQRTELHQTSAACANCHKILDPIGFGLENFDAIGRWRERDDGGGAIDASGVLPGGESFSTPQELKAIIASRKKDLARNLTERLLGYALGRTLEGYDEIVVDQMMESIAKDDYRMHSIITSIVTSYPFTQRRITP